MGQTVGRTRAEQCVCAVCSKLPFNDRGRRRQSKRSSKPWPLDLGNAQHVRSANHRHRSREFPKPSRWLCVKTPCQSVPGRPAMVRASPKTTHDRLDLEIATFIRRESAIVNEKCQSCMGKQSSMIWETRNTYPPRTQPRAGRSRAPCLSTRNRTRCLDCKKEKKVSVGRDVYYVDSQR